MRCKTASPSETPTPQEQLIRRESPEIVLGFLEPKVTGGGLQLLFFLRDGRLIYTFGLFFFIFFDVFFYGLFFFPS